MILSKDDILNWPSRYRATFINSLSGFKTPFLIASVSDKNIENLAIFNSLIHIGASPATYAFLLRPDTVRRDTYNNILQTGFYTFNFITKTDFIKAHKTSAKYDEDVSEFDAVGFNSEYINSFKAPFLKESPVKIGLKFLQKVDISVNGTILIIGSVEKIIMNDKIVSNDGFVDLEKEDIVSGTGLDAYYENKLLGRLSYAKPYENPDII